MSYTNIIDKLEMLLNLITSSQLLVGVIVAMILTVLLYMGKQISKKKLVLCNILIETVAISILVLKHTDSVVAIKDELIDLIFKNIYFPSFGVYMFIFGIMIIAFIASIVHFRMKKSYKIINLISFFAFTYLFITFMYLVFTNGINFFDSNSLYTNTSVITVLQLNLLMFVLWLIMLTINSISNSIYEYIRYKNTRVVNSRVSDSIEELKDEAMPTTSVEINNNTVPEIEVPSNNNEPASVCNYTLNEYKMFNNILKQILMLNSYKPNITLNDLLDENLLSVLSEEERNVYKNILMSSINN